MKIIICCVILILLFVSLNYKLFYKLPEGFEESNSTKKPLNKTNNFFGLLEEIKIINQDILITKDLLLNLMFLDSSSAENILDINNLKKKINSYKSKYTTEINEMDNLDNEIKIKILGEINELPEDFLMETSASGLVDVDLTRKDEKMEEILVKNIEKLDKIHPIFKEISDIVEPIYDKLLNDNCVVSPSPSSLDKCPINPCLENCWADSAYQNAYIPDCKTSRQTYYDKVVGAPSLDEKRAEYLKAIQKPEVTGPVPSYHYSECGKCFDSDPRCWADIAYQLSPEEEQQKRYDEVMEECGPKERYEKLVSYFPSESEIKDRLEKNKFNEKELDIIKNYLLEKNLIEDDKDLYCQDGTNIQFTFKKDCLPKKEFNIVKLELQNMGAKFDLDERMICEENIENTFNNVLSFLKLKTKKQPETPVLNNLSTPVSKIEKESFQNIALGSITRAQEGQPIISAEMSFEARLLNSVEEPVGRTAEPLGKVAEPAEPMVRAAEPAGTPFNATVPYEARPTGELEESRGLSRSDGMETQNFNMNNENATYTLNNAEIREKVKNILQTEIMDHVIGNLEFTEKENKLIVKIPNIHYRNLTPIQRLRVHQGMKKMIQDYFTKMFRLSQDKKYQITEDQINVVLFSGSTFIMIQILEKGQLPDEENKNERDLLEFYNFIRIINHGKIPIRYNDYRKNFHYFKQVTSN